MGVVGARLAGSVQPDDLYHIIIRQKTPFSIFVELIMTRVDRREENRDYNVITVTYCRLEK